MKKPQHSKKAETAQGQALEAGVASLAVSAGFPDGITPGELVDSNATDVAVTPRQLADCITTHRQVLVNKIRENGPPSDGAILVILQTLAVLQNINPTVQEALTP